MDDVKQHESRKLTETITTINEQQQALAQIPRYYGKDIVEQALDDQRQQQRKRLEKAAPSPYFGRLDFSPEASKSTVPLYIGKAGVEGADGKDPLVIDWRAPIASLFYSFTGQSGTASYEAPEETITGTVHLKRNIAIHEQVLERVVDSYVEGDTASEGASDDFLLYRLEESKDHRLRDIVSTIQSEQDAIIRAEREKALVIQGVPGSGKTTVALHRLAYLLYHYQDQIKPEKMVVFAPNQMFLDYISEVLPELGVGDIQQTTFRDWALDLLDDASIKLPDPSRAIQQRFESDHETKAHTGSRYKESIQFFHDLEGLLDDYENTHLPDKDLRAWEGTHLSKETIRDWYEREYRHYPLLKRRERVHKRMKRWIETEHHSIREMDPRNERKKQANKQLQAFMKSWKRPTPLQLYKQFLSTLIKETPRRWQASNEDLAPLLLIYHRLSGMTSDSRFDHIVIDEAQDFSPIQTAILQQHCPSNSFTILGDLLQNIVPGRGITGWEEILDQFSEHQQGFYQLDRSYRSTMEIIHFANDIIHPFRGNVKPAEPVFRSGSPVKVTPLRQDSVQQTIQSLHELQSLDCRTVAVITRTEEDARILHQGLLNQGLATHLLTPGESSYQGGLSIVPIYLVKGLEFDGAILTDVDPDRYPEDAFHARLLYVGCTRALHHLRLFYREESSPLLAKAINHTKE
ncbi:HelD family protein [Marininema halotolerans]|uniref:DNA helicase-2 / ATP-dependent DNA helicase PcrA n=1 Tax=Marininema halotolerans TaxID=1155944 RepID=A0A1I6RZN9_9BACL|nr:UvrD-helicase domain-containing protein [Marininema halotolerans]SFS70173.1 DNA helicase-2 / ATP-dependent DNA helicase PcrA [Marininema halotolerans]